MIDEEGIDEEVIDEEVIDEEVIDEEVIDEEVVLKRRRGRVIDQSDMNLSFHSLPSSSSGFIERK